VEGHCHARHCSTGGTDRRRAARTPLPTDLCPYPPMSCRSKTEVHNTQRHCVTCCPVGAPRGPLSLSSSFRTPSGPLRPCLRVLPLTGPPSRARPAPVTLRPSECSPGSGLRVGGTRCGVPEFPRSAHYWGNFTGPNLTSATHPKAAHKRHEVAHHRCAHCL